MNTKHGPKVSIVIATYNGEQFVEGWCESLKKQTYPLHEIIIIDNSLNSKTLEALEKVEAIQLRIFPQGKNLDFDAGYNLGMMKSTGDYVCILNQDLVMEHDAIEKLVTYMEAHPKVGVTSPALLRFGCTLEHPVIDALGLTLNKSRTFRNISEGERMALPTAPFEVFGLSGAVMCFRREALDALYAVSNEYFDELFVAYKEDVDLSYRLRHLGFTLAVVPQSVMYHKRTAQELKELSLLEQRAQKTFRIRGNSLKNQWWVLLKNEPWGNLILHAPWIFGIEFAKLLYITFTEPSTLKILPKAFSQLPRILLKRRAILTHSVISPKDIRLWIQ